MQDTKTKVLIKRIFKRYIKKHLSTLILALFCMILVSASTAINAWMMQPVLDDIFINKNEKLMLIIPGAVLLIAVVKGVASYFQSVLMSFVGYRLVAELQEEMFNSLIKCDIAYINETNSGTLISRFLADVGNLSRGVHNVIINILKDSLTFIFLVAVMVYHDPILALFAIIIFPLAIYPISRIGKRLRKISKTTQIGFGTFTSKLSESMTGIKTIKSFNTENFEQKKINNEIDNLFKLTLKSTKVNSVARPLMETLGGLAIALIIFIGGKEVLSGNTTPGTFFSFLTALIMAYQPVKSLASLNATLQMAMASAERVFEIIDTKPNIRESFKVKDYKIDVDKSQDVKFKRVNFKYAESKDHVLKNLNFEIKKGQKIALVGYSGAGKTTLLNLLPRFYDPYSGEIQLGGINIKQLSLKFLREHFSLVSQDIVLFDETIKFNIAYGHKKYSDTEILSAAKKANCLEFIDHFPKKFKEIVGENGTKLSGGQKQRIAIARAFLKNSPFLLLDEATSALDSKSEMKIHNSLKSLMKNRTSLIIAHRLSTIIDADNIILLNNGKVENIGTHKFLLKNSSIYKNLYQLQFKKKNYDKKNN
ncbi:MAG: Lipid A export ATP-binding/permease protein MsbA [Alphaproteobacteria bacterium MarineAlpha8_Bin1]|nr:MAG: Lipid A export ATP-binding/permease protein MsbA [Alphaproteobacteria bacterium MarineAlpha8_Bin1]